jgi:hypothetical protein
MKLPEPKKEVFKRLAMRRGNMTLAIQQAIEQWINTGDKQ